MPHFRVSSVSSVPTLQAVLLQMLSNLLCDFCTLLMPLNFSNYDILINLSIKHPLMKILMTVTKVAITFESKLS